MRAYWFLIVSWLSMAKSIEISDLSKLFLLDLFILLRIPITEPPKSPS